MSYLFEIKNNIATPTIETLLTTPYKEIWERDKTSTKEIAIKEFTYMEFMTSKKKTNPYGGFGDEAKDIRLREWLFDKDWKPDSLVEQGMAKIIDLQKEGSATYSYYMSVLRGAEKLKSFFDTFNMNERNSKDVPLYKPNEIVMAISNTDKVLNNLHSMKEKVEQELFEQTRTRGNKQINPFEE